MQQSNVPTKSPIVFGASATGTYIRTVPQTTADPAAASFTLGFPPQTFTDEGAGGTPPDGRDFNGILNHLSAWTRWFMAGGTAPYDGAFQAAIGGYPRNAIVGSLTNPGRSWRSLVDNNTTNPDSGGANWIIVDRLIAQDLSANGGYQVYESGYKRCWGFFNGPIDNYQTITFPTGGGAFGFTSWNRILLTGQAGTPGDLGASENPAWVVSRTLLDFQIFTPQNAVRVNDWEAWGV